MTAVIRLFQDWTVQRDIEDLYDSQKDAIYMLKSNNGGICDHEVGAGKTLIMVGVHKK
jgi:N12 class adenine-specific DNA methylase